MNENVNENDCMFYKEAVEERLKRIWDCVCGYREPISKYICGKNGVPSDERIEKLADELISRMRCHRTLDGASERFVRLYLYLAARAYDKNKVLKTFGDILDALRSMMKAVRCQYDSLEKLVLEGFQDCVWEEEEENVWQSSRPAGWFFGILDRSCEVLSGYPTGPEVTGEKLEELRNRSEAREAREAADREEYYARHHEKLAGQTLESLFPQRMPGFNNRTVYEPTDNQVSPEEALLWCFKLIEGPDFLRKRFCISSEEMRAEEEWKRSLSDPEKFLEAFREFLRLLFLVDLPFVVSALEEAEFLFLCQEGKSELGNDETFLKAYELLDMAGRCWDASAGGR